MFPEERYGSPTGKYGFRIAAWEVRMSHWIESFTLVEMATGSTVLKLSDSTWSLDEAKWVSEAVVEIHVRKYPGDHEPSSYEVRIDCEARTAELKGRAPVPLTKLEPALEELYRGGKNA